MTNAQKPNKHLRTKSNHRTTRKGARGTQKIFRHGRGKAGFRDSPKPKR